MKLPSPQKPQRVALLFAQFSAYHIERCQAVGERLSGRAQILAVEVATQSTTYAWEPSGSVDGARKITLFAGENYDQIGLIRRFFAQFRALWRCDWVFIGIGYNQPDVIALSWLLALIGVRVVALSESKFDDSPRLALKELLKAMALQSYHAAIVGAQRQIGYFRFLGFKRRRVLPGYDTVGLARVRAMGGVPAPQGAPHSQRNFAFVGRFVAKKNLLSLVEGYALYATTPPSPPRRLVLVGAGEDEAAIRAHARTHGVSDLIDFPGFLSAEAVARLLAGSLALILPSREEQWGLVVNEALAFGLPVIISPAVGSGDVLVRNLLNGYVIEHGSADGMAAALTALANDEALWRRMVSASHERAWLGDTARLADAVELLLFPSAPGAAESLEKFARAMACPPLAQRARNRPH